jgi:hypothetical protein
VSETETFAASFTLTRDCHPKQAEFAYAAARHKVAEALVAKLRDGKHWTVRFREEHDEPPDLWRAQRVTIYAEITRVEYRQTLMPVAPDLATMEWADLARTACGEIRGRVKRTVRRWFGR